MATETLSRLETFFEKIGCISDALHVAHQDNYYGGLDMKKSLKGIQDRRDTETMQIQC